MLLVGDIHYRLLRFQISNSNAHQLQEALNVSDANSTIPTHLLKPQSRVVSPHKL